MEYIKREHEQGYHNLGNNKFLIATKNKNYKLDLFYIDADNGYQERIGQDIDSYIASDKLIAMTSYIEKDKTIGVNPTKEKIRVNKFYNIGLTFRNKNKMVDVPDAVTYADYIDLVQMIGNIGHEELYALVKVTKGFEENFVAFRYNFSHDTIEGVYSSVLGTFTERKNTIEEIIDIERIRERKVLEAFGNDGIEIHDKVLELTLTDTERLYYENKR